MTNAPIVDFFERGRIQHEVAQIVGAGALRDFMTV